MHEHKFRVWATSNEFPQGKMYYPAEYPSTEGPPFLLNLSGDLVHVEHVKDRLFTMIWARIGFNWKLMEFTGRNDVNDKDVYEGDNLKCKDRYTGLEFSGIVDFQDCSFVIKNDCVTHYRWMDYEVEVVGNIFENPTLLK